MSMFTLGSHPTFEVLSAQADRDDVNAARTRIGRHVAQCSECRETVAEILALGAAVRAMPVEDATPALWARIDAASVASRSGVITSSPMVPFGDVMTERSRSISAATPDGSRRNLALGGIALAMIAALVAIVLVPNRSNLMATGTSRLTFSPIRPVPGGVLTVRYRPAPWLASAPRLVLAGHFAQPVTSPEWAERRGDIDAFGDSLATMLPMADGSYEGTLRLPADFLAVHLFVSDSLGEARDADGHYAWLAIGGTRRGAPSLDALLAAHDRAWADFSVSGRTALTQPVSIADSIQRYFPGHPAGWAFYQKYGMRAGILDLFRYFETAERKYASLDAKLWPMKHLDAERLHDMATLARRIDEPGETRKWADRLVREHPEDPRALSDLAESLHDVELKPVDHLADSIRPWIPVLETLRRQRPEVAPPRRAIDLVRSYGDRELQAQWPQPSAMPFGFVYRAIGGRALDTTAMSVSIARQFASGPCARPPGKFALNVPTSQWRYICSMRKSATWSYLSAVSLARGNALGAVALADSGLSFRDAICNANVATRAHARALLQTGDSAGAARDFATAFGQVPRPPESPDSLPRILGRFMDRASFDSISRSASRDALACERARSAANSVRRNGRK